MGVPLEMDNYLKNINFETPPKVRVPSILSIRIIIIRIGTGITDHRGVTATCFVRPLSSRETLLTVLSVSYILELIIFYL